MYRQRGLNVLKTLFTDYKKIECMIHELSNMQDEYFLIVQEVMNNGRNGMDEGDIMCQLGRNEYLDNTQVYENFRKKVDEHDSFLVKPFEVEEGVLECGKCNSNKTLSYTKQTRSGDESTSVFAVCYNCNNKWRI